MNGDTERETVRTYVPRYQKEIWMEEATEMEMSQSEFVRAMVQAGRSEFELPSGDPGSDSPDAEKPSGDDHAGGTLRERVLTLLSDAEPLDWDDLVAALTADIETDLDHTLETLQEENVIRYSGRQGGYVQTTNDDE